MNRFFRKRMAGITLMELMIVLIIIAILVSIAYPSYIKYVRKSKRGEAQQLLLNWAINEEIYRSNNASYAADDSTDLPKPIHQDGLFAFSAFQTMTTPATCTGGASDPNGTSYWLVAVAQGDQANDVARNGTSCATLCVGSTGAKQPADCWE